MLQQPISKNVISTWGLHTLREITEAEGVLTFPLDEVELRGWKLVTFIEHRVAPLADPGEGGSIGIEIPVSGRYFPAFILFDGYSEGNQSVEIIVNGERLGIAVAGARDNNQKLFSLAEPVDFKPDDVMELRNLNTDGRYMIEGLFLLPQIFESRQPSFGFSEIAALVKEDENEWAASLTFVTNWAAAPSVRWALAENLDRDANTAVLGDMATPLNNHRFLLEGLLPDTDYYYRIEASSPEGKRIVSPVQTFSTAGISYPPAIEPARQLAFQLSRPIPPGAIWPVTGGIPLPRGEVFLEKNFRLLDTNANKLPLQIKGASRWPDGSLKWVLLDFQATAAESGYTLEYGRGVVSAASEPASPSLRIHKNEQGVLVDTGALRVVFDFTRSGLWTTISRGGEVIQQDGSLDLIGPEGTKFTSLNAPDTFSVEEAGPLRAVVSVRGDLVSGDGAESFFRYLLRLHCFAGSPLLRVQLTLENNVTSQPFSHVKSAVLHLPVTTAAPVHGAIGEGDKNLVTAGDFIRLSQDYDDHFTVQLKTGNDVNTKEGCRAAGWLERKSDANFVAVAVRDFWQLYPKELQVDAAGIEIGLMPEIAPGQYERFIDTVHQHRELFYVQNDDYKLRCGMSFSTDIFLSFDSETRGAEMAQLANERPLLILSTEWYSETQVFGDIARAGEQPLVRAYDAVIEREFTHYLLNRDVQHEYGLLNFGDWWGERGINWGNIEYDTPHAFFLQFVRTGEAAYFFAAEQAAIHNRDVDSVHYAASPEDLGYVWTHSIGHTGLYFAETPVEGVGTNVAGFCSGHTWTEGHMEYYCLSGDRRSLEIARRRAENYSRSLVTNYDFINCRVPGWNLIMLMGVYNTTSDPFYLNAARIVVKRVLEKQTPNGGWDRNMTPGHCFCTPQHRGEAGFMVGTLLTGLKYFHQATGDESVAGAIVRGADYLIDTMWIPDAKAFRYTSCPYSESYPVLNLLLIEGLFYAWRLCPEERLRQVGLASLERAISSIEDDLEVDPDDALGKHLSLSMRSTPRTFVDLKKMLKHNNEAKPLTHFSG